MIEHLYIHIPYCSSKCAYCDFYSEFPKTAVDEIYVDALVSELQNRYMGSELKTIFFGGGTPSFLSGSQVVRVLGLLNLAKDCEITIECNPETITVEKLQDYKLAGVNRISIGVQSFDEEKLMLIGRRRALDVLEKIDQALLVFDNVGIDLMYALPEQNVQDVKTDISCIPKEIKHVSYYALTLEEGTLFCSSQKGKHPIGDDAQADLAEEVLQQLTLQDIKRYEISNFAKQGYECKHNLAYWQYKDYLGIGAGAVSTIKGVRTENVKSIREYTNAKTAETEYVLSKKDKENERIMMGLRTTRGISYQKRFEKLINKYPQLLKKEEDRILLTNRGLLVYNTIVSEMML